MSRVTSTPSTGWLLEFQPSHSYSSKGKREGDSPFPVRTLPRKCTRMKCIFLHASHWPELSHVLVWLQGNLGNAPSRWLCAWLSLGIPITMEGKESGCWDKQRTLSTSEGLKMHVENWQAFYTAAKKQSYGKMKVESRRVRFGGWGSLLVVAGSRVTGSQARGKRDCFAGVRMEKKDQGIKHRYLLLSGRTVRTQALRICWWGGP